MADLVRRFLYEPAVIRTRPGMGVPLGSARLNVSDVRDLMDEIDELRFVVEARTSVAGMPADVRPPGILDHVTLVTTARSYRSDALEGVGISEWTRCSIEIPQWRNQAPAMPLTIRLESAGRGVITAGAGFPVDGNIDDVANVAERVLGAVKERPVEYVATRVLWIAALWLSLGVVYVWYLIAAEPSVAEAVLIATVVGLVVWLAAGRIMGNIPRDTWGLPPGAITVTGTPREVMDQQRHDSRRDRRIIAWTLGLGIPLSGIGGSLLTILTTRN